MTGDELRKLAVGYDSLTDGGTCRYMAEPVNHAGRLARWPLELLPTDRPQLLAAGKTTHEGLEVNLRTSYNRDTDTLSLCWVHRESEQCSAWCSSHNTGWDMTPEQWLEVIGKLRRKIDAVQQQKIDLAAAIAEHGPAT